MEKLKRYKGITLISLIITVIILLILAGITISQLSRSGIFDKVREAQNRWQNAQEVEETQISKYSNSIEDIINSSRNDIVSDYRENLLCEFNINNVVGDVLKDSTGNNNDATMYGTGYEIKQENGISYMNLDGTTYAQTTIFSELNGTNEKSVMAYFRTNQQRNATIFMLGDDDVEKGGLPPKVNSEGKFSFETGCDYYAYHPGLDFVADGKWHFICITYNSKNIVIYLDNNVLYATNATLNTSNTKLTIGASIHTDRPKFIGDLANIRVYDKGLNMEQVYSIYKNTKI